jgi:hypothetical protein
MTSTSSSRLLSCLALIFVVCLNHHVVLVRGFVARLPINACSGSRQQQVVSTTTTTTTTAGSRVVKCNLVSEDDVLKAVEHAESSWAKALEARKTANALSDRAEEEAEAAASVSKEVEAMVNSRTAVSMEQLAQADAAASANLDATIGVNKALQSSEMADRLEMEAEEALMQSEERLEEHLKDFPESPLSS